MGCRKIFGMKWRSRRGLTMIELIVVIGVVSLLMALLLPAVGGARAAARRTSCLSKASQITLAWANRAEARKTPLKLRGMYRELSPYLEAGEDEPSRTSLSERAGCPADPALEPSVGNFNYLVCGGVRPVADLNGIVRYRPEVGQDAVAQPREFTDGMSNTILIGESIVPWGCLIENELNAASILEPIGGRDRTAGYTNPLFDDDWRDQWQDVLSACEGNTVVGESPVKFIQQRRGDSVSGGGDDFTTLLPPNARRCQPTPPKMRGQAILLPAGEEAIVTASSFHAGGVVVCYADGSGRFISEDVDRKIWLAAGTLQGEESELPGTLPW